MEIRIEKDIYNWSDLKDMLWCCDYQISVIEKHNKQDFVMEILEEITREEPQDIVNINDFIRFDLLEYLELEED